MKHMKKKEIIQKAIDIRQKYIDAELKHYRGTKEKSKSIRSKVSVMDEFLNSIDENDR